MDSSPPDQPEGKENAEGAAISLGRALVPLLPAQKRQAKDSEPGPKSRTTVFKSPRTNEVLKPVARHAFNPWLPDPSPSMRARHSAPGQEKDAVSAELRGSKSAPDLRAPVLAAIRGLQDGSIQVDGRTRAKIAHAAKRVLEARELRRRTSQEAYKSQGATGTAAPSPEVRQIASAVQQAIGNPVESEDQRQGPRSLSPQHPSKRGTASLDLPRADFRRVGPEDTQEDVLLSRIGDLRSGRASPFTVTTGMPRMAMDGAQTPGGSSSLKQARTRSTPIPVMPSTSPTSHTSLPRSLDFASELGQPEIKTEGKDVGD